MLLRGIPIHVSSCWKVVDLLRIPHVAIERGSTRLCLLSQSIPLKVRKSRDGPARSTEVRSCAPGGIDHS